MAPNRVAYGSKACIDVGTDHLPAASSQACTEYGIRPSMVLHFALRAGSSGPPPLNLM